MLREPWEVKAKERGAVWGTWKGWRGYCIALETTPAERCPKIARWGGSERLDQAP